jgi:hypothetical protein
MSSVLWTDPVRSPQTAMSVTQCDVPAAYQIPTQFGCISLVRTSDGTCMTRQVTFILLATSTKSIRTELHHSDLHFSYSCVVNTVFVMFSSQSLQQPTKCIDACSNVQVDRRRHL